MSALALMSLYVLYAPKSQGNGDEMKVASIVEQLKTVKRKRDFYQGWIDVKPGDSLSQNDEIYTHGQSSAKINFINGPEISLFENSLLRIKTVNKTNTFSLDKGNLIAKLNKDSPNLDIELGGKKYSFKSDNANIQIEQGSGENKFLLLDGKARLKDQEILPNQVVIQDLKTGNIKVKTIPFIPESPVHNLRRYFVKDTSVEFSWKSVVDDSPATLTIAKDANFKRIFYSEEITANQKTLTLSEAGTYFWRLTGKDQVSGPIKTFTLIEEMPVVVNARESILYKGPKLTDKAFISWPKNNVANFLLRLESPDKKTEEIKLSKSNYEFTPSEVGTYQVSVRVDSPERPLALWSSPLSLSVMEAHPVSITAITPPLLEKVNYNDQQTSQVLSWTGPSSVRYKVRLIKDDIVQEFETEQTSLPINLKDKGEYSWEVQGETLSGVTSNKIAGKIVIKSPLRLAQMPSEGAVIELEKPDQLVSFKWDKVEASALYQFELSDDPAFKKIIVAKDVETNNASTSLANTGRYFWRVKVKKGENVEYSSPVSVEIKPSPPLSRPEITPSLKIKLKYLEESSSFNIFDLFIGRAHAEGPVAVAEWDLPANSRAKSYIVEIYKDSDLQTLITRIETEVPHVIWKNATPGVFYWRVSYVDFWGRKTEFSRVSTLEAEVNPELLKPEPVEIQLLLPKHRAAIMPEEEDSALLSWEAIPETKTYQISISSDLEFTQILLSKKVNATDFKINCKMFDNREGEYYWKVEAQENASKRRMLQIGCAPKKVEPPVVIEEKTPVVEIKTEVVPVTKKENEHYLRLTFKPHKLSYENKANQYSAEVSGTVLNSWSVLYQKPIGMKYFQLISPTFSFSRGKVFKEITFMDMDLNLKMIRKSDGLSWGPMIAFAKKTIYVESNLKIADEGFSSPLAGVFVRTKLGAIDLNAEAGFGKLLFLHADAMVKIKSHYGAGVFVDNVSFTKEENKHSFMSFGLMFNYTFDFLDIE
ncbi:hypothetical protein DOM21_16515 [Bacteriovorax stolpii]|uniref:hypothetical protein n=1 Tax=Bacteriovorax stolpii TaxID=960 RepID=UPI001159C624|nr:hypothetical protein [Bacteriovorax stolpii]QDK43028.1 hypothetical protein DOM21_16515 [Bacteriovorax stolpii]